PSRTRGCSTNCDSAPTTSAKRWSSRRQPQKFFKSYQVHPANLSRCSPQCLKEPFASAKPSSETYIAGTATRCTLLRRIIRHLPLPKHASVHRAVSLFVRRRLKRCFTSP